MSAACLSPQFLLADRALIHAEAVSMDGRWSGGAGLELAGGRVHRVLARPEQPPGGEPEHHYPGCTILPGMVDAHVHTCLAFGQDLGRRTSPELEQDAAEVGRRAVAGMLAAGVTSARDLGAPGRSAQAVRDSLGPGQGVRLLVAGRPITSPAGHFASFGIQARGVRQLEAAVDQVADDGADWVKVVLTGGVLTPGTDPSAAPFDVEELACVVRRARSRGLPVAAHAHGTAGIKLAVGAGVDTIEHCTWAKVGSAPGEPVKELVGTMARQGQVVVLAGPLPPAPAGGDDRWARMRKVWANAAQLLASGVRVALGTDSFFGQVPGYMDLAVRAEAMVTHGGWLPGRVLSLVTAGGAAALGMGTQVGSLRPGAWADVVVILGDPSTDISALQRVVAVYRQGTLAHGGPAPTGVDHALPGCG